MMNKTANEVETKTKMLKLDLRLRLCWLPKVVGRTEAATEVVFVDAN